MGCVDQPFSENKEKSYTEKKNLKHLTSTEEVKSDLELLDQISDESLT